MKLQQLRHVLAVFERGSLRNAAEQLGVTQPAISRSIRELEQRLGVELFERSPAGMKLTAIGSLFVRRAQTIEAEVGRTLREIEQVSGAGYGTLTVGFSTAALLALMPEMLGRFHIRFPRTRLRIIEGLLPAMEAKLRSGAVDIFYGAVPANFSHGALTVEPLFRNPRIVIARPHHPLSGATSIKELLDASWVTTRVAIDTDNEVNALFEIAGLPFPRIAIEAETGMSIFTTVANTDLLAPVPRAWRGFIAASGLVSEIPLRDLPVAPVICSVRRAATLLSPEGQYLAKLARRAALIHSNKFSDPGADDPAQAGAIYHP